MPWEERYPIWLDLAREDAMDPHPTIALGQTIALTDESRPAHSPLGASGAERWMNCAGSVTLINAVKVEDDQADWTKEGLAAHDAAAYALTEDVDAWELVGQTFLGVTMTPELANPLQIYLDHARSLDCGEERWVEFPISSPVHPQFYGRLDLAAAEPDLLHIIDLKFGQGIMVEIEHNAQTMYYAFGFIDGIERQLGKTMIGDRKVRLTVVQPRGFHPGGPVRSFDTTVSEIKAWVHGVLVPAMLATEYDGTLRPGDWCRFCPARLVCPALTSLFKAAALAKASDFVDTSDATLGENYALVEAVKHYIKALEAEAFARRMRGREIPHTKLVQKKANRVYKEGAAQLAASKFGDRAFTQPELKSPAELEKLPDAGDWVKEFTYTPDNGLTLALDTDSRREVVTKDPTQRFAAAVVREQLTASLAQDSEW
jgi:hypothetical protein